MFKYLLFDLDGTLTDSQEGLMKSFQYALSKFGIDEQDQNNLKRFIGPPAHYAFCEFYNFTEEQAINGISFFRERFERKGIFENKLYPGIFDMLNELHKQGIKMALATSKPDVYANIILEHFNISQFFTCVCAPPMNDSKHTKTKIINHALDKLNAVKSETVMIGDRKFDILAAKECGIKSIGVSYGYAPENELKEHRCDFLVDSVSELRNLLMRCKNIC